MIYIYIFFLCKLQKMFQIYTMYCRALTGFYTRARALSVIVFKRKLKAIHHKCIINGTTLNGRQMLQMTVKGVRSDKSEEVVAVV